VHEALGRAPRPTSWFLRTHPSSQTGLRIMTMSNGASDLLTKWSAPANRDVRPTCRVTSILSALGSTVRVGLCTNNLIMRGKIDRSIGRNLIHTLNNRFVDEGIVRDRTRFSGWDIVP
jgi:hypothetical protein